MTPKAERIYTLLQIDYFVSLILLVLTFISAFTNWRFKDLIVGLLFASLFVFIGLVVALVYVNRDNEKNTKDDNPEVKYVYAYDPLIKRRVVHAVKDGWAISLVTGHKFKMENGENK